MKKSLSGKLFFWYATSLITVAAFFYFAIHIFSLPYGNIIFIVLLLILALEGFIIIRRITDRLSSLSSKMKTITSKNLDLKIKGFKSEDEIGELRDSFNQLLERLKLAFRRERQFIADIAHELRTPLSTMRTGVEVSLSKERTREDYKKALQDLLVDTNHMTQTLKNILDLAVIEAETARGKKKTANLSSIIYDLSDIAEKLAYPKNIKITKSITKNIWITGDRNKLERSILNIIDNAVKYSRHNKTIAITLSQNKNIAILEIKDQGIGIAPKDLPHIFDRFYRGSKTDKTVGSGLGLAIAKSIITSYNGQIEIKSKVGHQTAVTILFPLFTISS